MADVEILNTRQVPTRDRSRIGQIDTIVVYRLGKDPQTADYVVLPEAEPDKKAVADAVATNEREKKANKPRTFQPAA